MEKDKQAEGLKSLVEQWLSERQNGIQRQGGNIYLVDLPPIEKAEYHIHTNEAENRERMRRYGYKYIP